MILKQKPKIKRFVFLSVIAFFVLSFFVGIFDVKEARAETVIIEGVSLRSKEEPRSTGFNDGVNVLTYLQAKKITDFDCEFNGLTDFSINYDHAKVKCSFKKILKDRPSVKYQVAYNDFVYNADRGVRYDEVKRTTALTNSSNSAGTLSTEEFTIYFSQGKQHSEVLKEFKLEVTFAALSGGGAPSPPGSALSEEDILELYRGTFQAEGDGLVFQDDFTRIVIGGSGDRPRISFKLKHFTGFRGGQLDDANLFYFYSENTAYPNLAIRLVHDKVGDPRGVGPNGKYKVCNTTRTNATGRRDASFVVIAPGNLNEPSLFSYSEINNDASIYFNNDSYLGFFNKYYNEVGSGTCPSVNYVRSSPGEALENAGVNIKRVESATSPNSSGYSDPVQPGVCPDDTNKRDFLGFFNGAIMTGMACWFLNVISGIGDWIIGFLDGGKKVLDIMRLNDTPGKGVTDNDFVIKIWKFIRSIVNIVFLIGFLIAALFNVANVIGLTDLGAKAKQWEINSMLKNIVTSVILVNFSLAICNLTIDVADVLVTTFLGGDTGLTKIFESATIGDIGGNALWAALFNVAAYVTLAVMLLYVYILMYVRWAAVALLVMFSGAPYIAKILPFEQVNKVVGKWSGEFTKWIFMAPMLSLFLWIIAQAIGTFTLPDLGL